jgi:hypothetical protein
MVDADGAGAVSCGAQPARHRDDTTAPTANLNAGFDNAALLFFLAADPDAAAILRVYRTHCKA